MLKREQAYEALKEFRTADRWLDRALGDQLLALQTNKRDDLPFHITGPGVSAANSDDAWSDESVATWAFSRGVVTV